MKIVEKKVVAKIDLCSSKAFFSKNNSESNLRSETYNALISSIKYYFPDSSSSYPDGCMYSGQGDCIHLILDDPTIALRCTIEFMKYWSGLIPSVPDCKAVVDVKSLTESRVSGRTELHSEAFDIISVIEKQLKPGQIAVTNDVMLQADNAAFQFIKERSVTISPSLSVSYWLINYTNPRLLQDSSLIQATFLSDSSAHAVRNRAIESIVIEHLLKFKDKKANIEDVLHSLKTEKPISGIDRNLLEIVVSNSNYLFLFNDDNLSIKNEALETIALVKKSFDKSKETLVNEIIAALSSMLNLTSEAITATIDISSMIEEYLCAVFLELRFMASYFTSTNKTYTRLIETDEFDYIFKKYVDNCCKGSPEKLYLFKIYFLNALSKHSNQKSSYIASIFHNVLLLYYLNANYNYNQTILDQIRKILIFLDSNVLYSLRCKASQFNNLAHFLISSLHELGANINIYNISVNEFNDSLENSLHRRKTGYFFEGNSWINREYALNPKKYNSSFEYCVGIHKVPQNYKKNTTVDPALASATLSQYGINLEIIENVVKEKGYFGETFYDVYNSKMKKNQVTGKMEVPINLDLFEEKIFHDCNCLDKVKCEGDNPLECEKVFLTADFRLAKIRRNPGRRYNYLTTITEFYEFILPYLFTTNTMSNKAVEMPNFLLAASLSISLGNTPNFKQLIGESLQGIDDGKQDYVILSKIKATERYRAIKEKHDRMPKEENVTQTILAEMEKEAKLIYDDYIEEIKTEIKEDFASQTIGRLLKEKEEEKNKRINAEEQLEKIKHKEKKQNAYKAKQRKKAARSQRRR